MKLWELRDEIEKLIRNGQGSKEVFIEGQPDNLGIDSIQKDTVPHVEANYWLIMRK